MKRVLSILSAVAVSASSLASAATFSEHLQKTEIELGFTGNFATKEITPEPIAQGIKLHTIGGDLTGVYRFRKNQAFTLRFGYTEGSMGDSSFIGSYMYEIDGRLRNISLMPGYRYYVPIYRTVSAFAGVNLGLLSQNIRDRENWNNEIFVDVQKNFYGLAYSLEAGLKWQRTEHIYYFITYQFSGSTNHPTLRWNYEGVDYATRINRQSYHSIRTGVSWNF